MHIDGSWLQPDHSDWEGGCRWSLLLQDSRPFRPPSLDAGTSEPIYCCSLCGSKVATGVLRSKPSSTPSCAPSHVTVIGSYTCRQQQPAGPHVNPREQQV